MTLGIGNGNIQVLWSERARLLWRLMGSWNQMGGVSWQERRLSEFMKASILRAFCILVFIRSCHGKSHCRVLSRDVA